MIKRLLKTVRRQPKAVRDKIAMGLAGVFTALVATVWLYGSPDRFSASSELSTTESPPAFSQFFSNIGDQLAAVKESLSTSTEVDTVGQESPVVDIPADGTFSSVTEVQTETVQVDESVSAATPVVEPQVMRIVTTSSTATTTAENQ